MALPVSVAMTATVAASVPTAISAIVPMSPTSATPPSSAITRRMMRVSVTAAPVWQRAATATGGSAAGGRR